MLRGGLTSAPISSILVQGRHKDQWEYYEGGQPPNALSFRSSVILRRTSARRLFNESFQKRRLAFPRYHTMDMLPVLTEGFAP